MKNFLTGTFIILTCVMITTFTFALIAIVWNHLTDDAKTVIILILLPTGLISALVGYNVGENFWRWKNK